MCRLQDKRHQKKFASCAVKAAPDIIGMASSETAWTKLQPVFLRWGQVPSAPPPPLTSPPPLPRTFYRAVANNKLVAFHVNIWGKITIYLKRVVRLSWLNENDFHILMIWYKTLKEKTWAAAGDFDVNGKVEKMCKC